MPLKKSALFSKKVKSKRGGHKDLQGSLINSAIVVLSLLLVAFIFSYPSRTAKAGR